MIGDEGGESRENLDDTLMLRVAEGNAIAFETLVRRNMRRALAIAQGVTGNANDADEIAQEAFMRVWQHAQGWDPGRARFTTWLHRIVLNLCLDRRRKPGWLPIDVIGELPDHGLETAPEKIARAEHREVVARAMDRIPQRQRAAVTLFYFEGMSGHAAAEIMGVTVAAFEQLLLRARRAVKAELAAAGFLNGGELL
jgi:RNA polymerase sigma-70 factor (ECF subfamily)